MHLIPDVAMAHDAPWLIRATRLLRRKNSIDQVVIRRFEWIRESNNIQLKSILKVFRR